MNVYSVDLRNEHVPADAEEKQRSKTVCVIAHTALRAIFVAQERHPGWAAISLWQQGEGSEVLIDPLVGKFRTAG